MGVRVTGLSESGNSKTAVNTGLSTASPDMKSGGRMDQLFADVDLASSLI